MPLTCKDRLLCSVLQRFHTLLPPKCDLCQFPVATSTHSDQSGAKDLLCSTLMMVVHPLSSTRGCHHTMH